MITAEHTTGLPAGWSIRITPVTNACTVTLVDDDGIDRRATAHPRRDNHRDEKEITVHRLADIADPALRACASELVTRHRDRLTTGAEVFVAFRRTVGRIDHLTQRLDSTITGLRTEVYLDLDTLSVVTNLHATWQAIGPVCSLITTWLTNTGRGHELPAGVTAELDEDDPALIVTLDQPQAESFFTWYNTYTEPEHLDPVITEALHGIVDYD
ncbi:hypothetical protein [Nocardia abscessus]|uniref:hypothetical protein n=1 Tax=Nocardia abscessus TaxID=120957 RepID=UPI00245538CE|nr:hypothetical protein [Nocardia abscessus]